jgi:hypothetical protein
MELTLEQFKTKHFDLIERGMIRFTKKFPDVIPNFDEEKMKTITSALSSFYGDNVIIIDRFTDDLKTVLGEARELNTARSDVRKMGYINVGIGVYKLL